MRHVQVPIPWYRDRAAPSQATWDAVRILTEVRCCSRYPRKDLSNRYIWIIDTDHTTLGRNPFLLSCWYSSPPPTPDCNMDHWFEWSQGHTSSSNVNQGFLRSYRWPPAPTGHLKNLANGRRSLPWPNSNMSTWRMPELWHYLVTWWKWSAVTPFNIKFWSKKLFGTRKHGRGKNIWKLSNDSWNWPRLAQHLETKRRRNILNLARV